MSDPEKVVHNEAEDMISELPGNVIERILELMPLRDAAKTSILSKRWRYNWASLPQLVFDTQFFKDAAIRRNKVYKDNEFTNIVNEVLLLHTGPIQKCIFFMPESFFIETRDVDRWILFLSRNGLRELTLINLDLHPRPLPSHLFSCQLLTHLKLRSYTFKSPPAFKGFHYLRSLNLKSIRYETNIFESLFSSSPLLERLTLMSYIGVDYLNIHALNLKYLKVHGRFKSIRFLNTPKLAEVFLTLFKLLCNHSTLEMMPNLDEVMGCLPRVEKLHMRNYTLKVLGAGGVPKRLATTPNFLKYLELRFIDFCDVDQISCALCLIRSSINLQELEFLSVLGSAVDDVEPVLHLMGKQDCADCILNQLRIVKMQYVMGSKPELEFIKYLLACSPNLELMLIGRKYNIDANANLKMSRELMQFSRASQKAAIVYFDPPYINN